MPSPFVKLAAAAYYGVASITLQFMNKALFTTFEFKYPVCVALLQMAFMCPVCYMIGRPKVDLGTVRLLVPLAMVGVMNTVSGLIGTGGLNVPMFIALRRFTLLVTIGLEVMWFRKKHSRTTYTSVAIMICGSCIAAVTDLTFNLQGYLAIFINDLCTAAYLVLIKNTKAAKDLTTIDLLFYNSMLSLPLLLVAVVTIGEVQTLHLYPRVMETGFQACLAGSSMLGLLINHAQFLCTRINEPLMTSVAGQIKNIVSTIAGAVLFGDFIYSIWNVTGLVLSSVGSIVYATHSALKSDPSKDSLPVQIKHKVDVGAVDGDKLKNYSDLGNNEWKNTKNGMTHNLKNGTTESLKNGSTPEGS